MISKFSLYGIVSIYPTNYILKSNIWSIKKEVLSYMGKSLDFYKENIQSLSFSGVSTDEQETIIVFGRNNDTASV